VLQRAIHAHRRLKLPQTRSPLFRAGGVVKVIVPEAEGPEQ
jgi:hypothetical protein